MVGVVVVAILTLCCATWRYVRTPPPGLSYDPLERARELVAGGDSRKKAIELLSADAWYHQPCYEGEDGGIDLFFYGSHGYDSAKIVIVRSRSEDGEIKVTQIGTYDPSMWQSYFSDCIDEERFEYGLYERCNDAIPFFAP